MPTYEHACQNCNHEWEQVYGMTVDPPTLCPECGVDGKVKRLISLGPGPGIMRRTSGEVRAGMAAETRAIRQRAKTDENFRANLVGEDNYNQRVLKTEQLQNELVSIGEKASAVKSLPSTTRPKIKTSKSKK